jgi:hypothetical protein
MLKTIFKSGLAAFAATALLCAPDHASAALTPVDVQSAVVTPEGARQADHLAQAVRHAVGVAAPTAVAVGAETLWFSMPDVALQSPQSIKLRASSDLALWHLVATVHAQQQNKAFDVLDAGTKTVWKLEHDNVSAVPLPGVLWLFVMGLLGIAGTRLQGKAGAGRERQAAQPMGLAPAVA